MKGKTNSHKLEEYIPSEIVTVNVSSSDGNLPEGFEIYITLYKSADTEYTQLEYIESTGSQYIDTGFKMNQDTRVIMSAQLTSVSSNTWLFEGRNGTGGTVPSKGVFFYYSSTKKWTSDYGGSTYSRKDFSNSAATDKLNIDYNKNICTINGESVTHPIKTFLSSYNVYLLADNRAGTASGMAKARLYSCKIYDNGILIRDYIPAKNAEGVIGLYDKVNKTFSVSLGTNLFTGGPEVSKIIDIKGIDVVHTQTTASTSYKIPIGSAYTISAKTINNYCFNDSTIYVASLIKKVINVVYLLLEYGVYIMDASGNIGTVDAWTSDKGVTGVVLITDISSFIIAPDEWISYSDTGTGYNPWSDNWRSVWANSSTNISGIMNTNSLTVAKTDFLGSYNTDCIIKQCLNLKSADNASKDYIGAPAAEYCRAYSKGCKDKGQWYLPSAGETNQICMNIVAIEQALTKILGTLFVDSSKYSNRSWTSTQGTSSYSYACIGYWNSLKECRISDYIKTAASNVRPICSLNNVTDSVISFKIKDSYYPEDTVELYAAKLGMTWREFLASEEFDSGGFTICYDIYVGEFIGTYPNAAPYYGVKYADGTYVSQDDLIISGYTYKYTGEK